MGEAPNSSSPNNPYLGIGTANGEVIVTTPFMDPICIPVAHAPITDLGGLPQVGSFALGVVSDRVLYWVDPETDPIVTANGTKEIATLLVPANLTLGGVLSVVSCNFLSTAISQIIFSSLTATPGDARVSFTIARSTLPPASWAGRRRAPAAG